MSFDRICQAITFSFWIGVGALLVAVSAAERSMLENVIVAGAVISVAYVAGYLVGQVSERERQEPMAREFEASQR